MNEFVKAWEFLTHHKVFSTVNVITTEDVAGVEPLGGLVDAEELIGEYWTNYFREVLDIDVAVVNPETGAIDTNPVKNSLVQIWLECGTRDIDNHTGNIIRSHDVDLDCGAATFEDAIIELAELVREKYGEDQIV